MQARQLERVAAFLPLAAAVLEQTAVRPDPDQRWWQHFCAVAPAAVLDYVADIDAEAFTDPASRTDETWCAQRHPAFEDVCSALYEARGMSRHSRPPVCTLPSVVWRQR